MDPYLEDPDMWPSVHSNLVNEIQGALNRQLRPRYVAAIEERVYVVSDDDLDEVFGRIPDVRVLKTPLGSSQQEPGGAAVMEEDRPVRIVLLDEEVREPYLEILDAKSKEVVTVIEVVSPWNKRKGSPGRKSFLGKRRQVMDSPTHWMEIDLLRQGERFRSRPSVKKYDYVVHVSRANQERESFAWRIRLPQRLPTIQVPLRQGDPDASLNLQEVLNAAYDRGSYDLRVDYRADPAPPLTGENAAWADQWLKNKGLR
jgi:hypothetical protein